MNQALLLQIPLHLTNHFKKKLITKWRKKTVANVIFQNNSQNLRKTEREKNGYDNIVNFVTTKKKSQLENYNKEHRKKYNRFYERNKSEKDITSRLKKNLRTMLRIALLRHSTHKEDTTQNILGKTYQVFEDYIKFLMLPGMTWDNIHLIMSNQNHYLI